MENASKALIIAGETLIAILVAGLIVYAISSYGNFSKNMNAEMENSRTSDFNTHFLQFYGRVDITADEIATIINFAKHSNDNYELYIENGYSANKNSPYFVDVHVPLSTGSPQSFFSDSTITDENIYQNKVKTFLEQNNSQFYMCNIVRIKDDGMTDDRSQKKIKRIYKDDFSDIKMYSNGEETARVVRIIFSKTTGVDNFNPTNRDDFFIE